MYTQAQRTIRYNAPGKVRNVRLTPSTKKTHITTYFHKNNKIKRKHSYETDIEKQVCITSKTNKEYGIYKHPNQQSGRVG